MTIRKAFALFVTLAAIFVAAQASAQSRDRYEDRYGNSRSLEARVAALEDQVYELRRRVDRCEGGGNNGGGGYNPRPSSSVSCITQDTIRGDIFIGKGRIQLEAEQAARESCARNSSAIYCKSQVRCSDSREARRSLCFLTDSIRGDNFKGEGESAIEAEFNVRRSCASRSAATYCMQKVTCQSF